MIERSACPTCGSCSGMFTANSMNCLTEALGLSLPGNGTVLATHADRKRLFVEAGHLIVDLARRYYEEDDESVLPRNDRQFQGVRKRHDARHLDGRLHQHRAAPARRRARGRDRLHHVRHRPAVAPRARALQGRALGRQRPYRGRAPRRRHHGHSGRTRPRRSAQPRRPDGACAVAGRRAVAQRHQAQRLQRGARVLPRRARRRADPGRLQPGLALRRTRRGSRKRRHPRRRARFLERRRPRRALRQHRRSTAAS